MALWLAKGWALSLRCISTGKPSMRGSCWCGHVLNVEPLISFEKRASHVVIAFRDAWEREFFRVGRSSNSLWAVTDATIVCGCTTNRSNGWWSSRYFSAFLQLLGTFFVQFLLKFPNSREVTFYHLSRSIKPYNRFTDFTSRLTYVSWNSMTVHSSSYVFLLCWQKELSYTNRCLIVGISKRAARDRSGIAKRSF